jgi:Asp/Glu/hydantoin racemase
MKTITLALAILAGCVVMSTIYDRSQTTADDKGNDIPVIGGTIDNAGDIAAWIWTEL